MAAVTATITNIQVTVVMVMALVLLTVRQLLAVLTVLQHLVVLGVRQLLHQHLQHQQNKPEK